MLSGGLLSVFFGSGIGVVGTDMLVIEMLVSEFEGLLDRSAFLVWFVVFGEPFGLEVAIGVLEGSKDGDVVGSGLSLSGLVLLLIGWQLD